MLHAIPKFFPSVSVVLHVRIYQLHPLDFAVSKGKRAIKEDTKKVICSSSSNVLDYRNRHRVWAKLSSILVRYIGNWHLLSSLIFL